MRTDGVQARGIDMTGVILTLILINAVHRTGGTVVTPLTDTFVRPINVFALFIDATRILQDFALVYIFANGFVC